MIATIQHNSKKYKLNLTQPIDVSIPINVQQTQQLNAWYINDPKIFPEEFDGKKINVSQGAAVNFNTIHFNPHSHITHTECAGHITQKVHSIHKNLNQFFFLAEVITVAPEIRNNDEVISKKQLQTALKNKKREAVVIRTLPNLFEKKTQRYSNTNPPYLLEEAAIYLREKGVNHLLIDLPSVDKEKDNGQLLAHNAFWNTAQKLRLNATITEFIYVPNTVKDGTYFLNLMVAPFENDATPSRPILYELL